QCETLAKKLASRPIPEKSRPEEVEAIRFIRFEAVRALGHSRTHTVTFQNKVLARPGLILLKVANADGIIPSPSWRERAEAIAGFLELFPQVTSPDRDMQTDYAAYYLGNAMLDLAKLRVADPNNVLIAWKYEAERLSLLLEAWQNNVATMRFPNA